MISITPIRPISMDFVSAINSIQPIRARDNIEPQEAQSNGAVFADMLKQLIDNTNVTAAQSRSNANELAWGLTDTPLHNIEIDALRADLALRTLTSVRNKVLEAYTEVMRITI